MVRIENILCPVDFYPASERALDYAAMLARNHEARLTILHVVPAEFRGDVLQSMSKSSMADLKKLGRRLERKNIEVRCLVRNGHIDDQINTAAKAHRTDLIVMSIRGRRGFKPGMLGSVIGNMLRRATVPVLTIGSAKKTPAPPGVLRRILVLTDFSDGTADALAYAFSVAQESQARVTLLHVIPEQVAEFSGSYRQPLADGVRSQLERQIPDEARDWCDITTRVETGPAFQQILGILKTEPFDLAVMNIHGETMFDRELIGSTAERIVRGSAVPVLVVPPMEKKRKKKIARS